MNKFIEAAEKAKKEQAKIAKEKAEKAKIDKIQKEEVDPINDASIQEAMQLVKDGKVHVIRDDDGNAVGLSKKGNGVVVNINGMPIFVGGENEKDVENGVKAAIFHVLSRGNTEKVDTADQLVEAGAATEDIKDIGDGYIINFKDRTVMSTKTAEIVVNLNDIKEKLSAETIEMLLKERLSNLPCEEDCCDCDDDDFDEDDFDEDEEDLE